MQITLNQDEIEQSIQDFVRSQISIADDQEVIIDLKSTRGETGMTAILDIRSAYTAPVKKTAPKPTPKKKQTSVAAAEPGIMDADADNETDDEADPIPETSQESDDACFFKSVEETPPSPTPTKAGSIFNFANTAA